MVVAILCAAPVPAVALSAMDAQQGEPSSDADPLVQAGEVGDDNSDEEAADGNDDMDTKMATDDMDSTETVEQAEPKKKKEPPQ